MKYYPINLDIKNRRCVVIGGGEVAERKVRRLLESNAKVIVVGKKLTAGLLEIKKDGLIEHIEDDYKNIHVNGAFLVIGATDNNETNTEIFKEGRKRGVLVNIVDAPEKCDFILPAIFQQGDLTIAISTGGKSPALAKKLRQEMEFHYGPEYRILLKILGNVRDNVIKKGRSSDDNKELFESVVNSDILKFIRDKDWKSVREIVRNITGDDIEVKE